MSELLPSEVARLILGYFEQKGYSKTAEVMLNELPELSEISTRRKKGRRVNLRVGDLCLYDIFDDYYATKDLILENLEKYPSTFSSLKKVQPLIDHVRTLLEMAIKSKTYKFYPKNLYKNRKDHGLKLNSPESLDVSQNISITVGDTIDSEAISNKGLNTDTTPESSLPGSSVPLSSPPYERMKTPDGKDGPSNASLASDPTPQKRKGSLRKRNQPSPKSVSKIPFNPDGDEKMEKLIKNLIENTALHQKIAENINKTLYTSTSELEEMEMSSNLSTGIPSAHKNQAMNFSNSSIVAEVHNVQDVSPGSKANLPDNVISSLSLQVTNDPMVESILASIDCDSDPTLSNFSNRLLSTPIPPTSPSHSSRQSLPCTAFSTFQTCNSMSDIISQPTNSEMVSTHGFTVHSSLPNYNKVTEVNVNLKERDIASGFPLSFTNDGPVVNKNSEGVFFVTTSNYATETLGTFSHKPLESGDGGVVFQDTSFSCSSQNVSGRSSKLGDTALSHSEQTSNVNTAHPPTAVKEKQKLINSTSNEYRLEKVNGAVNSDMTAVKHIYTEVIDVGSQSLDTGGLNIVHHEISDQDQPDNISTEIMNPTIILDKDVQMVENIHSLRSDTIFSKPISQSDNSGCVTSTSTQALLMPRTPQQSTFCSPPMCQKYSPSLPHPNEALPVASADAFVNSKYFSGTPDHPGSYTLTELTPLPLAPKTSDDHNGCILDSQPTIDTISTSSNTEQPEQSTDQSTTLLINNEQSQPTPSVEIIVSDCSNKQPLPFVSRSEGVGITGRAIITDQYLGSRVVKLPDNDDSSIVLLQMPFHNSNLQPILPNSKKTTLDERRKEAKKKSFNMRSRRMPIKIKPGKSRGNKVANLCQPEKKTSPKTNSSKKIRDLLAKAFEDSSMRNKAEKQAQEVTSLKQSQQNEVIYVRSIEDGAASQPTNESEQDVIVEDNHLDDYSLKRSNALPSKETQKEKSFSSPPAESENISLNSNIDMEKLVDELESRSIENVSVVQNNKLFGSPDIVELDANTSASNDNNLNTSKSREVNSCTDNLSTQLESLVSFSKSFTLNTKTVPKNNSPAVNNRGLVHKGSLSTPRNKREHVRALDFSTPRKVWSSRKLSPKARASLRFSSSPTSQQTSPMKRKILNKKSPLRRKNMGAILEDSKEETAEDSYKADTLEESVCVDLSLSKCKDPRLSDRTARIEESLDRIEDNIMDVDNDLFISEDETQMESTSNAHPLVSSGVGNGMTSLRTPGKDTSPIVCLEVATPIMALSKTLPTSAHENSTVSELNTPVPPTMPFSHCNKSPYLKSYPQGPYSNSSEGTYYQPSERSVTELESYSPLQDDIESVLIRTAQRSEEQFVNSQPLEPVNLALNDTEAIEPAPQAEETVEKNPIFDELLQNRPKYKVRKLSNEQLGKVVEEEMELFRKMRVLAEPSDNGETEDHTSEKTIEVCNSDNEDIDSGKEKSDTEPKENGRSSTGQQKKNRKNKSVGKGSTQQNDGKSCPLNAFMKHYSDNTKSVSSKTHLKGQKLKVTFKNFDNKLEILKTFTIAALRNSHIESAKTLLQPLLTIFKKAEVCVSSFSEDDTIDLLLGIINFYASPEMIREIKKQNSEKKSVQKRKKPINVQSNFEEVDGNGSKQPSATTEKTGESSQKSRRKPLSSAKSSTTKYNRKTRKLDTKGTKVSAIDLVECEIEAVVVNGSDSSSEVNTVSNTNEAQIHTTEPFTENQKSLKDTSNTDALKDKVAEKVKDDRVSISKRKSVNSLATKSPAKVKSKKMRLSAAKNRSPSIIKSRQKSPSHKTTYHTEKDVLTQMDKDSKSSSTSVTPSSNVQGTSQKSPNHKTTHPEKDVLTQIREDSKSSTTSVTRPSNVQTTSLNTVLPEPDLTDCANYPSSASAQLDVKSNQCDSSKSSKPALELGCIVDVTPKRNKYEAGKKLRLNYTNASKLYSSPENSTSSSAVDDVAESSGVAVVCASTLNDPPPGSSDDYCTIERQLAALDGSVTNSPDLREQLLQSTCDEENISAMFTPTTRNSEDTNEFNNIRNEPHPSDVISSKRTTKLSKPLISFTPLPGTPEKAMEEICQTVVKDKVALVAFPSLNPDGGSDDSNLELSKKVKDVSKKLLLSSTEKKKNQSIEDELYNGSSNIQECSPTLFDIPSSDAVQSQPHSSDENDSSYEDVEDDFCTLSFSETFDLLTINLEPEGSRKRQRDNSEENANRRKVRRLSYSVEDGCTNDSSTNDNLDDFQLIGTESSWRMNRANVFLTSSNEVDQQSTTCTQKEVPSCRRSEHFTQYDEGSQHQLQDTNTAASEDTQTEKLASGATGISRRLSEGGTFELSVSPKKIETLIAKYPVQDTFSYMNEDSVYSIPPTPGKGLFSHSTNELGSSYFDTSFLPFSMIPSASETTDRTSGTSHLSPPSNAGKSRLAKKSKDVTPSPGERRRKSVPGRPNEEVNHQHQTSSGSKTSLSSTEKKLNERGREKSREIEVSPTQTHLFTPTKMMTRSTKGKKDETNRTENDPNVLVSKKRNATPIASASLKKSPRVKITSSDQQLADRAHILSDIETQKIQQILNMIHAKKS